MQIVPRSVGVASRAWDEQHLDLESAGLLVAGADTGGFTSVVAGPAAAFTIAWGRLLNATGNSCEAQADGLRQVLADWVRVDTGAALSSLWCLGYLQELR